MSLATRIGAVFLTAGLLLPPLTARASDFCVVGMAIPPQCYYDDVKACIDASTPPNTFCGVNPEARLMYYGSSRYCVVHSAKIAECMYDDYLQCNNAAGRAGGICADRNQKKDDINPFRYDRRIEN